MIWPTVALLTSAAALVAAMVTWYANRRLQNIRRSEKHRNGFFESAETVISDERISPHLAAFVVMLSMGLSNKLLPYFLLAGPRSWGSEKVREDLRRISDEMESLPEDLRCEVAALRFHGLMAIVLQSVLIGGLLADRIERAHRPRNRDHDRHDGEDTFFGRAAAFQIKFPPTKSPASQLFAAP